MSTENNKMIIKLPMATFEDVAKMPLYDTNGRLYNFKEKMTMVRSAYKEVTPEIIRTDVWKRVDNTWDFLDAGKFKI